MDSSLHHIVVIKLTMTLYRIIMNLYAFRYLHLKLIICFSNPGTRTVFAFGTKVKNVVNDKCHSFITVTEKPVVQLWYRVIVASSRWMLVNLTNLSAFNGWMQLLNGTTVAS